MRKGEMTAEEFVACMGRLKLTQAEMARALGVDQATVSRWSTGHRAIPGPVANLIPFIKPSKFRGKVKNGRPRKVA
jgi:DNA-binding transcriptional regulator YiaG